MQSIQPTDMRRKTPALELYILNWQGWGTAGAAEKVSLNISVHLFTARALSDENAPAKNHLHNARVILLATKEIVKADIEDRSLWHMLLFCLPGKILKSDTFIKCVITLLNTLFNLKYKLHVTCSSLNSGISTVQEMKKSLFSFCQHLRPFLK